MAVPVDVGVVQEEDGVVGGALNGGQGPVHEDVDGGVHSHTSTASTSGLRIPET